MENLNNNNVKTLKDLGTQSFFDCVKVGDKVDNDIYQHFLNVVDPLTFTSTMLQVGSAYDHINGKGIYTTFVKKDGYWTYMGNCFRGETEDKTRKYY